MDLVIGSTGYSGVSKSPCNLVLIFRLPPSPERNSFSIKMPDLLLFHIPIHEFCIGELRSRWLRWE